MHNILCAFDVPFTYLRRCSSDVMQDSFSNHVFANDECYVSRAFKAMADAAAPPNLMGYLFAKDVMKQSLRLGLAGAWAHTHPDVMKKMRILHERCPSLVQSFLPVSEQDEVEAETRRRLHPDSDHVRPGLSLSGFVLPKANEWAISSSTKPGALPHNHLFVRQLREAYSRDYSLRNVMDLGHRSLRWFGRVGYTNESGKRKVFRTGDYVLVGQEKARLSQCFVHEYRGTRYVFLMVHLLAEVYRDGIIVKDNVLDLPVFSVLQENIYGLFALHDTFLYFLSLSTSRVEDLIRGDEADNQGEYLLECTWGLEYL